MARSVLGEELVTLASKSGIQAIQATAATLFAGAGVNTRLADNLAATSEDKATALQLTAAINRITSASPEAGVNLPEAALLRRCWKIVCRLSGSVTSRQKSRRFGGRRHRGWEVLLSPYQA